HPVGEHALLDRLLDDRVIVHDRTLHLVRQAQSHGFSMVGTASTARTERMSRLDLFGSPNLARASLSSSCGSLPFAYSAWGVLLKFLRCRTTQKAGAGVVRCTDSAWTCECLPPSDGNPPARSAPLVGRKTKAGDGLLHGERRFRRSSYAHPLNSC